VLRDDASQMISSATEGEQYRKITITLLSVIAAILLGWAIKATYIVIMPLAFAFFLVVLVQPIQRTLNNHLPSKLHWLSLIACTLVILAVIGVGVGAVWLCIELFLDALPRYSEQLAQYWTGFVNWAQQHDYFVQENMIQFQALTDRLMRLLTLTVASISSIVAVLVLIFFFILLMLLEVRQWQTKAQHALNDNYNTLVLDTVKSIAHKLRQYLLIRTITSIVTAVTCGLWLWILGVDLAFLWGVMIFVLNYVPYIGSIIAVIPPTLVAFVQFGIPWTLVEFSGLTCLQMVIGNFVDPHLQGKTLRVSPIVLLLSIVFWSWAWGMAGALLAVPLTVMIIVTCAHVPALQPIALMLSRDADEQTIIHPPAPTEPLTTAAQHYNHLEKQTTPQ